MLTTHLQIPLMFHKKLSSLEICHTSTNKILQNIITKRHLDQLISACTLSADVQLSHPNHYYPYFSLVLEKTNFRLSLHSPDIQGRYALIGFSWRFPGRGLGSISASYLPEHLDRGIYSHSAPMLLE